MDLEMGSIKDVLVCDFCGAVGPDVIEHDTVPDRYGKYIFCQNDCYDFYGRWVYSWDLTNGVPYYVRKAYIKLKYEDIEEDRFCHNCECRDESKIVRFPTFLYKHCFGKRYCSDYKYQYFCMNETCLRNYISFARAKPNTIPAAILMKYGCQCKKASSN